MAIVWNETDPNAREFPFHLSNGDPNVASGDPTVPVLGHVWNDVGDGTTDELQLRLPGGAYQNVTITQIAERGYGDYAVVLTLAQVASLGYAFLELAVPGAQPGTFTEAIVTFAQGIVVGESHDERRELPFHLNQATVNPLLGLELHAFVAGEVRIRLPGAADYVDVDEDQIVEKGGGDYALVLTDVQVLARGKVYLYASVAGSQPWSATYEIVDLPAEDNVPPMVVVISPTPGVPPGDPGGFPRSISEAKNTPIVLKVEDPMPGVRYIVIIARFYVDVEDAAPTEEVVFRRGQFRGKYVKNSFWVPTIDGIQLSVRRTGGWPASVVGTATSKPYIVFAVDALDADGNLAA